MHAGTIPAQYLNHACSCFSVAEDPLLPLGYTAESVIEGKAAAKAELRKRMQLSNAGRCLAGLVCWAVSLLC